MVAMKREVERESLGRRFQRFCVFVGGIFALSLGFVVGQRLSTDALAMLMGLALGVGVMVPALLLMVWMWRRQDDRQQEQARRRVAQQAPSPPVVVVAPPMFQPGYRDHALGYDQGAWNPAPQERKFTIVGGGEV
jgi:hypothetical protein